MREIADTLTISEGSVFTILHESLGMRKLLSKWVPRLLTLDQKQRVEDSERCLELLKQGKKDFLRRYVTMNETWIHHYKPETKRSSAEWTAAGESRPKLPKIQQWAGKVMASVFWDAHGILFIDYHENMASYAKEKALFHQDNVLYHNDYWLFADLKKMLQGKRFGSSKEVIAETEAYFESKDESFYKKGIEKLEKRWNECITLEGNYKYIDE